MEPSNLSKHPAVIAINAIFEEIEDYTQKNPIKVSSDLAFVAGGLFNKVISHCAASKLLATNSFLAEASMVLRGTFETVVHLLYLAHNESEVKHYRNHSRLVEYKDSLAAQIKGQMQSYTHVTASVTGLKREILKHNLLKEPRYFIESKYNSGKLRPMFEDGSILNDPDALAACLPNTFVNWRDMLEAVKDLEPELYRKIKNLNPEVYNYGSQLLHSHWHCVSDYHIKISSPVPIDKKPRINLPQIFLYILTYLECIISTSNKLNFSPGLAERLQPLFDNLRTEVVKQLESAKRNVAILKFLNESLFAQSLPIRPIKKPPHC